MTVLAFHVANGRGARRPAAPTIDVHRLTTVQAADWQRQIMAECRRQRVLTAALPAWLEERGLMDRCTYLSSVDQGTPLVFRFIGAPTLAVLGKAWGRTILNQPAEQDPHEEFAHRIGAEYAEAIGAGEAVVNRITVSGMGQPFSYVHAVFGWSAGGRRAILSAVDLDREALH